jgi:protein gp37
MAENSKIEWTDHTFNPWSGCQKVSAGCLHCYAETMAKRNPKTLGVWGPQGTRVRMSEAYWRKPYKWNERAVAAGRRERVFCASMADVFEDRPELVEWRVELFRMIVHTRGLDWLLLTKRPQNVMPMLDRMGWPSLMENVWIGTSVEDQQAADERIPHLLAIPATVRFLSMEPLLGPVDLRKCYEKKVTQWHGGINWVIVGGESGHGARPIHPDWVRSIRDQCRESGVPFFFKQWGEYVPVSDDRPMPLSKVRSLLFMRPGGEILQGRDFIAPGDVALWRAGKKAAGRLLDGAEWNGFSG